MTSLQADALRLPIADHTVDLIISSPPFCDEHYPTCDIVTCVKATHEQITTTGDIAK